MHTLSVIGYGFCCLLFILACAVLCNPGHNRADERKSIAGMILFGLIGFELTYLITGIPPYIFS